MYHIQKSDSLLDDFLTPAFNRHSASIPTLLSADYLFVKQTPLWKRVIDVAGSLFGIILLSPLLFLIGLYIKIISPGPVLFTQERIGRGGLPFKLYKFRTMHIGASTHVHEQYLAYLIKNSEDNHQPGPAMAKLSQDQRIIRYGQVLRTFGFDELPQLINILLGQMSLVGPRPAIPYEVQRYKLWFRGRLDVLPGLTGLWQVSGKNRLGFNEMIRLDIQYVRKQSFILDLKILLTTPFAVLKQIYDLKAGRS